MHGKFCAAVVDPSAGGIVAHADPESENELFRAF